MNKTFVSRLALAMVIIICLATITVLAADTEYVPSIEAVAVPEIVSPEGKEEAVAVIDKADGSTEDVGLSDILTLSYNEAKALLADSAISEEHKAVCERFIAAHDAFKQSGGVKESIQNINEFVEENLKMKNPQYVVSNVFELNIGAHADKLEGDGKVTISFDNSKVKAKNGKFLVAHMVGDEWKIVPSDDVKVTDEVIEVTFDQLCPVAFINVEGEAIDEPVDNNNGVVIAVIAAVVVIGAGVAVFFVLKKKGVIDKLLSDRSKK